MSIIQTIREKGAKVSVVLIALALIGFILTDYFSGKNRGATGGGPTSVGTVNGSKIPADQFQKYVDRVESNMRSQGYPAGGATTTQAIEQAWAQEVGRILFTEEFDKLGMKIGKKELGDILYGPNAPQDLKSQFTDSATGQYNAILAKQQIDQMLKKGTPEQKDQFNTYIIDLEQQRKSEKLVSMLANTVNYPRWMIEKQNADNSQLAKISFVRETYSSIPDSAVKITDKEIQDYINKHKDDFKQEESRSINYVRFSAAPTAADSADAINKLMALKAEFDTTDNIENFLAKEGAGGFYDGYLNGKGIQIAAKDSIFRTPVGSTYGPYLDGQTYTLAKMIGVRQMPDTAKVRHILIATSQRDPQSGQMYPVRSDEDAKKIIDSVEIAMRNGSNFDTVLAKLSEDPGSKDKKGEYEIYPGQMVAPFNDFAFLNPIGTKGVVKTEFGYHYMEVLSHKGGGAGYKIAYLPKEIIISQETDNNALNKANQFAGDSRDQKSFDANFEKTLKPQGLVKGIGSNIKPADAQIPGLGDSRVFVRAIYDAKKGEVLKTEKIGNDYIVAVVTEVFEEGTQSVATARTTAEPALRNKKKAEMLKQKIGKITTLEAAATTLAKPIETADSIRMSSQSTVPALGYEPRIVGAAFNPANKGKVVTEALEGQNGVYVVRVENVSSTPVLNGDIAEQRKSLYEQSKQRAANPQAILTALRKAATIKDKRAEKY